MQVRNNQSCNIQLYFRKENEETKQKQLEYVHVPGNATVEIDDEIWKQITESKTEVREMKLENQSVDGAEVFHVDSKEKVVIKEYYETGATKKTNLVLEDVKAGRLSIMSRVKVSAAEIDQLLVDNGVAIKDMPDEKKLELYNKLA